MQYVKSTPNPSGAYPGPQSRPFAGCLALADEQAAVLVQYNGFVTIIMAPDPDVEASSVTVAPDLEAWGAWKAEEAEKPKPEPEPTDTEVLNTLLGVSINE